MGLLYQGFALRWVNRQRVRERPGVTGLPLPFVAMESFLHIYRREDRSPGDPNQSCPTPRNHVACLSMGIKVSAELFQGQQSELAAEIAHP